MRLDYSVRASQDLENIHLRISVDSLRSADRMLAQLTAACRSLIDFPEIGRPSERGDTRELVTVRPYVIIYSVQPSRVFVERIYHGAQRR